ncbi:coiled-coil domain-containing protein 181-like isoform X2 [Biomphalaria glabrata]
MKLSKCRVSCQREVRKRKSCSNHTVIAQKIRATRKTMESESLENNNNVTKVNIRHEPETDLKRKDENHEHIPLQHKPSLSDDDQDIVTSSVGSSEISDTRSKTKTKTKVDLDDKVDSDSEDHNSNPTQKYGNSPELKEKPDNQNPPEDISGSRAKVKVKSTDGSYEPSDNDSEPEGEYSFTEDQKRAMMELMVQKHEEGDIIDEDPPEYNVKGRLLILNAELANDPIPDEGQRETRVGFKPEIVDLVAPPPSYLSDDEESQPNSARGDKPLPSPDTEDQKDHVTKEETAKAPTADQYVVERDGNFTVLSSKELTPAEYELYAKPNKNEDDKNAREHHSDSNKKSRDAKAMSHDHSSSTAVVPKPPSRPRPNTAAPTTRRKTVQSTRPKSAAQNFSNSDYNSPYALSKEQKEQVKKEAKRLEEERHEKEKRRKEEEEEKQKENMSAYDAWIKKKEEEEEENRKKKQEKKDDNKEAAAAAYQSWLKEKRSQGKKEKLLRRRQQQERNEDIIIHTPEDCDKAYREWLKKKNLEMKKQNASEKQKYKFYKLYLRKSRRSYALLKALKEVQSSPYLDYYGYRF